MHEDIIFEDTTLRDGEQTPGIAFSAETKLAILDALLGIGVRWVEIGIPAMGGEELAFIKSVVDRQDEAHLVVWHRGVREDVESSLDLGFRAIHIGLPTSQVHLDSSVRKDRQWLLDTARSLIAMVKDRGAFASVSAEDLARTDVSFLQEYACVVHEAGADRLRLSDTIGILSPEEYGARVAAVHEVSPIDLQCHAHNDFGLGTANALRPGRRSLLPRHRERHRRAGRHGRSGPDGGQPARAVQARSRHRPDQAARALRAGGAGVRASDTTVAADRR